MTKITCSYCESELSKIKLIINDLKDIINYEQKTYKRKYKQLGSFKNNLNSILVRIENKELVK